MKNSMEFFEANKKVDKFFVAEDGGHFVNKNDAHLQAASLKKMGKGTGKVTPITRAEAVAEAAQGDEVKSGSDNAPAADGSEGGKGANMGLLKGAITRAQNALDKIKDGGDAAAVAAAQERLAAAQKAYADAGGV